MYALFKSVYLYSLCLLVGSAFFLVALAGPAVDRALSTENAQKFLSTVYPRFFWFSYITGFLSLLSLYTITKGSVDVPCAILLFILLAINIINIFNGFYLAPKLWLEEVEYYRTGSKVYSDRLALVRRLSGGLSAVSLILGLMAIGITSGFLGI